MTPHFFPASVESTVSVNVSLPVKTSGSADVSIINYGINNLKSVTKAFEKIGRTARIIETPQEILAARCLILPGIGAFEDGMKGLQQRGLIEPLRKKVEAGTPLLGICLGMQMLFSESEEFGVHTGLDLIPGRVIAFKSPSTVSLPGYRVPHMGWNALQVPARSSRRALDTKKAIVTTDTLNAIGTTETMDTMDNMRGKISAIRSSIGSSAASLVESSVGSSVGSLGRSEWKNTLLQETKEGSDVYFVHSFYPVVEHQEDVVAVAEYGGQHFCAVIQKKNIVGCQFHPEKSGDVGLQMLKNFCTLFGVGKSPDAVNCPDVSNGSDNCFDNCFDEDDVQRIDVQNLIEKNIPKTTEKIGSAEKIEEKEKREEKVWER